MRTNTKKFALIGVMLAAVLCFSLAFVGLGTKTARADADVTAFAFESEGAYVKISDNGGLRFRLKMGADKKAEIVEGGDLVFYAGPAAYINQYDANTNDYETMLAANKVWKVTADKSLFYQGNDASGERDGYWYSNILLDVNTLLAKWRTVEFKAVAVFDGEAVVSPARSLYAVANACALDAFFDEVMDVYSWLGSEAAYKLNVTTADQYEVLAEKISEFSDKHFSIDGVDGSALVAQYPNGTDTAVESAKTAVSAVREIIDDTVACGEEITAARTAYNALSDGQKALAGDISNLTDAEAVYAKKSVIATIASFNAAYAGITLENYRSTTTSANSVNSALSSLTAAQKARMKGYNVFARISGSYTVVDGFSGTAAEVTERFDFSTRNYGGQGKTSIASYNNGASPVLMHSTYGTCISIGKTNGGYLFLKHLYSGDLSDYSYVLIGIRNGTNAEQNWYYQDTRYEDTWKAGHYGLLKTIPANMSATGQFVTFKLTVEQFKNWALFTGGGNGNVWVAPIIAVKTSEVVSEIEDYLDAVGTGVELTNYSSFPTWTAKITSIDAKLAALSEEDKELVYNLSAYNSKKFMVIDRPGEGSDIKSRFTFSSGSNGINNGETAPNVASALNHATYGKCATIGKNANALTIRYSESAKQGLDLTGYKYVLIGVKNSLGATINVQNCAQTKTFATIENGAFGICKLTVSEFLNDGLGIYVSNQGSVWITTIIAVAE